MNEKERACLEGSCPICGRPLIEDPKETGWWVPLGHGLAHMAHGFCWQGESKEELDRIRARLEEKNEEAF